MTAVQRSTSETLDQGPTAIHDPASPTGAVSRSTVRDQLQDVVGRLVAEFSDGVPAGGVIRCVARCTEIATKSEVPASGLSEVVERMARSVLNDRIGEGSPRLPDPDVVVVTESAPRSPPEGTGAGRVRTS